MPAIMKKKSTRGWRKTPYKKTTTAKVATLTKQVRRIRRSQELKWHDVAVASVVAGQVEPLNNVPLGDDAVARDGRKIVMTELHMRGAAGVSASVSASPRFCIVYDKSPNGVLPTFGDIFTSSTFTANPNLNNRSRFRILYDNQAGLGRGRDPFQIYPTGAGVSFIWTDSMKLKDLETIYKDTGSGTMAGTATGALYAVFLGSGSTATIDSTFRLRYYDS